MDGKPDKKEAISQVVNAWIVENIHGSPVAQSTAAWNHLYASIPDLVDRLAQMEE